MPLLQTDNIDQAADFERGLPPGKYLVRLTITSRLSQEELNDLCSHFLSHGLDVEKITQKRDHLSITYTKMGPDVIAAFPFIELFAIIPIALLYLTVAIGIFRIDEITRNLMPILLATGAFILITVAMIRKPLGEAAGRYVTRR